MCETHILCVLNQVDCILLICAMYVCVPSLIFQHNTADDLMIALILSIQTRTHILQHSFNLLVYKVQLAGKNKTSSPIDGFPSDVITEQRTPSAHVSGKRTTGSQEQQLCSNGTRTKTSMTRSCCAVNCTNKSKDGWKMFNIPRGSHPFAKNRRKLWLQAIKRADWGASGPTSDESLCGAHFKSGRLCLFSHYLSYAFSIIS